MIRLKSVVSFCAGALLAIASPAVAEAAAAAADTYEAAFPARSLSVGDATLSYRVGGQGPAVVLIHGWPVNGDSWRQVAPLLAASGRTVIVVDTRGLGKSSAPAAGYDKLTLARDVHELVAKLGHTSVDVVGHDLGGQIAYAYAMAYPSETRSVAILNILMAGLQGWDELRPWHFAFNQVRDLPETLTAGRERAYLAGFYRGRAFPPEEVDRFVTAYSQPGVMHAGFEYYRAFPADAKQNQAWATEGRKLTMPVLWLSNPGGFATTMPRQLTPLATRLQGTALPGCGHYLPMDCAAPVVEQLTRFWTAPPR